AVDLTSGKDATGHISLRSAIQAANALGGPDTINLPAGVYRLTLAGPGEDAAAAGDLDITGDLTIGGGSASNTVVDSNNLDLAFHVLRGNVSISFVTVQHGRVTGAGGGVLNAGG